jgi:cell division inhibitor SepF
VSVFRTIAVYLGLGPDDEYDDGYAYDEPMDEPARPSRDRSEREPARGREPEGRSSALSRPSSRRPGLAPHHDDEPSAVSSVRSLRPVPDEPPQPEPAPRPREPEVRDRQSEDPTVRPIAIPRAKPAALTPQSFADAKVVADEFKRSVPVIINLQGLDKELVRRLVDFSSGLCYGLDGHMEKIAAQVFLLTPKSVEVSAEERRRIEERGFDR